MSTREKSTMVHSVEDIIRAAREIQCDLNHISDGNRGATLDTIVQARQMAKDLKSLNANKKKLVESLKSAVRCERQNGGYFIMRIIYDYYGEMLGLIDVMEILADDLLLSMGNRVIILAKVRIALLKLQAYIDDIILLSEAFQKKDEKPALNVGSEKSASEKVVSEICSATDALYDKVWYYQQVIEKSSTPRDCYYVAKTATELIGHTMIAHSSLYVRRHVLIGGRDMDKIGCGRILREYRIFFERVEALLYEHLKLICQDELDVRGLYEKKYLKNTERIKKTLDEVAVSIRILQHILLRLNADS